MSAFFKLVVPLMALLASVAAFALEQWRARQLPTALLNSPGAEAPNRMPDGLPDGIVTHFDGSSDVTTAWYIDPTTRYRHGILGDAVEAGGLRVRTREGRVLTFSLPESEVFEDRYPRLADLDNDGLVEIVTIRSSLQSGASVTVYGLAQGAIVERATTGFIGRSNRWLNIAGIEDFLGNENKQIAFVKTPHIGGTLFLFSYSSGALQQVAAMAGFSNHVIGSREMRLTALADIDQDGRIELALPSDDRRFLRIVGYAAGRLGEIARVKLPARIDKAIHVQRSGNEARFIVGLDSGESYEIHR